MASFKNKRKDQLSPAPVIGQLVPERATDNNNLLSGCETWRCAFSPDGSYFAWSSGNKTVSLIPWSSYHSALKMPNSINENGQHISKAVVTIDCQFLVRSVAFGLSSKTDIKNKLSENSDLVLATGHCNGHIRIWDVISGGVLLELVEHQDMVSDLSFAPDGSLHLVSASYDGTLKVWDLKNNGTTIKTVKVNTKPIYCCAWAPNARTFVSVGMSKVALLWDRKTYCIRLKLVGHQHDVVSCDFSPDNSIVATASWDTRVILWDAETGKILKTFGHLFPPPNRISTRGGGNGIWIRGVSFSPDGGHIATVADDGFVRFWDLLSDDDPESVGTIQDALCCAYSPKGQTLAVGTRNGTVTFFQSAMCVKPLLYMCRLVIRRLVEPEDLSKLFIPRVLGDFLSYKDGV